MKSKVFILSILLVLVTAKLPAQYFQRTYGDVNMSIRLGCGVNTTSALMGLGHLMVGTQDTVLHVVRTNVSGAAVFDNYYNILNTDAIAFDLTSAQITEVSANAMIIIGTYRDQISLEEGIFFLNLTAGGVFTNLTTWRWAAPVTNLTLNGMYNLGGNTFYVAGGATYNIGGQAGTYPVVAAFNLAGAQLWANIYSMASGAVMRATDVEYSTIGGLTRLYVVGSYQATAGAFGEAFMFSADPATGNPFGGSYYGTPTSHESFTGITTCNTTTVGGQTGLLMSGNSNSRVAVPVNHDAWIIKTTPTGFNLSSNLYDYAPTANLNNFAMDIMERRNPSTGVYTYFTGGFVIGGIFGLQDMHVIRTNNLFASIGNYTYGSALDEYAENLAQNNNIGIGAFAGLAVFGTQHTTATNRDFLLAKGYFNGVTACNFSSNTPNTYSGPDSSGYFYPSPVNDLVAVGAALNGPFPVPGTTICTALSVAGGSNAKAADSDDENAQDFNIDIMGETGVRNLSAITIGATEPVNATVEVVNLLGATLFRNEMKLNEGNNTLPNTGEITAGILVVRVTAENGMVFTRKILIQ